MAEPSESRLSLPRPFNAYDFFGILIPGACFLISVYLFEVTFANTRLSLNSDDLFLHWIASKVNPAPEAFGTAAQAGFFALGVIFIYVIGHVIAAISSLFIDRIIVFKGYGYPYAFLLLKQATPTKQQPSPRFYRGSVFWLNLWVMCWIGLRLAFFDNFTVVHWVVFGLPFIMAVSIKPLVQFLYEDKNKTWLCGIGYKFLHKRRNLITRYLKYYAAPYNMFGNFVENFIRTHEPFPKNITENYHKYFYETFQMKPEESGSDNYWFSTFFVFQRDRRLYEIILQWYQISSFARNIATAFYLAYMYAVISLFCKIGSVKPDGVVPLIVAFIILFALSCIMAIRFYHCFVSYYSKGLFRAFVYLNLLEETKPAPKPKSP